jgi:ubiquinone/menaquinone biosynthesis C-methylase UbiE
MMKLDSRKINTYSKGYAAAYDRAIYKFAAKHAPIIRRFYELGRVEDRPKTVLDICCGTGQMALNFAQWGYRVVGVDASKSMLAVARRRCSSFLRSGRVQFVLGDSLSFKTHERFGLVVCTFDSVNHFESVDALRRLFSVANRSTHSRGILVFDIQTITAAKINHSVTRDGSDFVLNFSRSAIPSTNHAIIRAFGAVRSGKRFIRFDQTVVESFFPLRDVETQLRRAGWKSITYYPDGSMESAITNPEDYPRVMVVARN